MIISCSIEDDHAATVIAMNKRERRLLLMKEKKGFLGILFGFALMLCLMSRMSLTAWATTDTYNNLIPTDSDDETAVSSKVVHFNNYDWYIIADDSTAEDEGTITLFAKDPIGASKFAIQSNEYSGSTIESYLDELTTGSGSFADVADVIVDTDLPDVSVTGAKLWLLKSSEAGDLNVNVRKCSQAFGAHRNSWWVRTSSSLIDDDYARRVMEVGGNDGYIYSTGAAVYNKLGVRPALKLDLSSVIFASDTKTFSLKTDELSYVVTYKVVNGTWSDNSTEDITETVQSGSKPINVPTEMEADSGYTLGSWDRNPADAVITKDNIAII